jgi:hypothetical protein
VCDGVAEEFADQFVDTAVEGCREKQTLAFTWSLFQDASYVFKEPKLGHVVGFVQDGDFNCVEFNLA